MRNPFAFLSEKGEAFLSRWSDKVDAVEAEGLSGEKRKGRVLTAGGLVLVAALLGINLIFARDSYDEVTLICVSGVLLLAVASAIRLMVRK